MDNLLKKHELVLILDFGSQYTHLIARRLRECNVYCELKAFDIKVDRIKELAPKGIILSGGPHSVYEENAPHVDAGVFDIGVPILGICYGLQEMAHQLPGGAVEKGHKREFGRAALDVHPTAQKGNDNVKEDNQTLLNGVGKQVWMSHGDKVVDLPDGFSVFATTENSSHAVIGDTSRKFYGVQFHPEVTHTEGGINVLRNFTRSICACAGDWSMDQFSKDAISAIQNTVGANGRVVGAVSGGVDSTVAATLVAKAIGDRFHAVFVNNGLLRLDEVNEVMTRLQDKCGVKLKVVDSEDTFLDRLKDVTEPEKKRKIIGRTFIEIFEKEAIELNADYLLQGTLYPDVIESVSHKGPSATIKTHHNVGALPEHMKLKLIEPLRFLFKDEVRNLGISLGIDRESIFRHPFPGPGLAIRILGNITLERLRKLKQADKIFISALHSNGIYLEIAQAFAVLLPVKAVGVMGDRRTYEEVITLRAVKTTDFMTADWAELPYQLLRDGNKLVVGSYRR